MANDALFDSDIEETANFINIRVTNYFNEKREKEDSPKKWMDYYGFPKQRCHT